MEFSVEPYRVTITSNGKRDVVHFESTMAACKALVSGVEASWTIAQWRKNEVTNELAYCGIGSFGGKIFAFRMGTQYAKSASLWMFETFKKSGMRKDLNNTTYVERDFDGSWVPVGSVNKLDKLLISMGF